MTKFFSYAFVKIIQVARIKAYWCGTSLRSYLARTEIERLGGKVGENFSLRKGARISFPRGAKIVIGNDFHMAEGAELFVQPGAKMEIGDGVFIGKGSLLSASQAVHIGSGTQIAHYVTIIDSDHNVDPLKNLKDSGFHASPVKVGDNTWIGSNAVVLKGVNVGKGCVIGAGATVSKSLPERHVATGNPSVFRPLET